MPAREQAQAEATSDPARLRMLVEELSAIHRPSASAGELRAAGRIVEQLDAIGATTRVDIECAHGHYWLPLALLTGVGAIGALAGRRNRTAGAALAGAAAAAIWDDLTAGEHYFRRALPSRATYNVVAELGPADAERTVVLIAHHDAARSGLIFHPEIPAFVWRHFPQLIDATDTSPPLMFPVLGGPALAAAGSLTGARKLRALGGLLSAAAAAVLCEIGSRAVVPGANDNVTGVVTLLALAQSLAERPTSNVRVLLVSTGSEESFMEGMHAFAKRHFPNLPRESTFVLAIDTVGSPHLTAIRGEGMLRMFEYPRRALDLVDSVADDLGIYLFPNLRLRNATDGLYALKAGYMCACLGSVTEYKTPANYHWPTDTAENVDYATLADAIRLCEGIVRRLDERGL